jgi:hypothetical protein
MHDDDAMDRLLRNVMAADPPQLSPAFDARLMRRVRPHRLAPMGRVVIAVYVVIAAATAAWAMQDLPMESIVAAVVIAVPVAAGPSAYARRLAVGH